MFTPNEMMASNFARFLIHTPFGYSIIPQALKVFFFFFLKTDGDNIFWCLHFGVGVQNIYISIESLRSKLWNTTMRFVFS